MKFILLMLFPVLAYAGTLPNPELTPGAARTVDLETLCHTSTKLVRHTSQALKNAVYQEYGLQAKHAPECTGPSHACYEVDHLVPLEDGGADVKENLWPQSYEGACNAHQKDAAENELHKLICNGTLTIQQAQTAISTNWIQAYQQYVDKKGCE